MESLTLYRTLIIVKELPKFCKARTSLYFSACGLSLHTLFCHVVLLVLLNFRNYYLILIIVFNTMKQILLSVSELCAYVIIRTKIYSVMENFTRGISVSKISLNTVLTKVDSSRFRNPK